MRIPGSRAPTLKDFCLVFDQDSERLFFLTRFCRAVMQVTSGLSLDANRHVVICILDCFLFENFTQL